MTVSRCACIIRWNLTPFDVSILGVRVTALAVLTLQDREVNGIGH